MPINQIIAGAYAIPLGGVNVYLLESLNGLVLIDTGSPGNADVILQAVHELGKQPSDIHHILLTHLHPDHTGSLATLKRATGAQSYAHPLDASIIRQGGDLDPQSGTPRTFLPAPGMETMFHHYISPVFGVEGAAIDHEINEGDALAFLADVDIIFAPGS